jgi:hypothetical protein
MYADATGAGVRELVAISGSRVQMLASSHSRPGNLLVGIDSDAWKSKRREKHSFHNRAACKMGFCLKHAKILLCPFYLLLPWCSSYLGTRN